MQPDYFAKGYEYQDDGLHPRRSEEMETLETYGGEMLFTPGDIVYSSSALIEIGPPDISIEKLLMLMQAEGARLRPVARRARQLQGHRGPRRRRHHRRQPHPLHA